MESFAIIKDDTIRHQWDEKTNKWHFSIVDAVGIMAKSSDSRNYWKVLKNRLKKAQNKLVTSCNQLKMQANDGKFYLTDTGDEETILEIVKLVSPEHVLPFRLWFDNLDLKNPPDFYTQKSTIGSEVNQEDSYPQVESLGSPVVGEKLMLTIDGYRKNDFIIIQAFVAGADIENLLISVTCKTVTVKGKREIPTLARTVLAKNDNYDKQELYWGKFSRSIALPEEVEINQVQASEHYGLLTIKLPLINKSRFKMIKVKTINL